VQGDQCNSDYNFLLGPLQTNLLNFHLFDENLDSVCVHSRGSYNKVASQKASAFVCYQLLARYDAYILSKQSLFICCFPSIRYLLKNSCLSFDSYSLMMLLCFREMYLKYLRNVLVICMW